MESLQKWQSLVYLAENKSVRISAHTGIEHIKHKSLEKPSQTCKTSKIFL
ncbi:MAG: hypothetical protein IKK36_11115 [Bacteroidales bacterium]|nr:hypothetical protein [Bacteroidales bacterium]